MWIVDEQTTKQYEITFPALARYFCTHFESGVKNMQMIMEKGTEKELPNNCNYISSEKSSFIYWFENGSQVSANKSILVRYGSNKKLVGCQRKAEGSVRLKPDDRTVGV